MGMSKKLLRDLGFKRRKLKTNGKILTKNKISKINVSIYVFYEISQYSQQGHSGMYIEAHVTGALRVTTQLRGDVHRYRKRGQSIIPDARREKWIYFYCLLNMG
jgi:hypothetical protein